MLDANKFRAKVVEHGGNLRDTAKILGCDESTLSRKLKGGSDFTRGEILRFMQEFSLTQDELVAIFFTS